jgi:hypothetical protein
MEVIVVQTGADKKMRQPKDRPMRGACCAYNGRDPVCAERIGKNVTAGAQLGFHKA